MADIEKSLKPLIDVLRFIEAHQAEIKTAKVELAKVAGEIADMHGLMAGDVMTLAKRRAKNAVSTGDDRGN